MTAVSKWFSLLLTDRAKKRIESLIIYTAILGFLLHLLLIALVHFNVLQSGVEKGLLQNPIAAIYTPFSFIIVYEVYLLIYYLPRSTTIYIGKQYEIITLIIIRRLFKDLSHLEFTENWISVPYDLQFTVDLIATLLLFFLILLFYRLNRNQLRLQQPSPMPAPQLARFIKLKKTVSALLLPVFFTLAVYSLLHWISVSLFSIDRLLYTMKNVNQVFFDDFFTVLILVDVLLLLFSFFHTDSFYKIIRNSGFIISTILIKLSFAAEGILNVLLILVAVLFGVILLWIHNRYERMYQETEFTPPQNEEVIKEG
ncbi:hypothetical protein PDL71_17980 [Lacibacter sp. MH-610]|uniref:hypothetical protein n=1 Tax=Lacibacter sp. MH-610 TaxID=3020883 RepID=UPI0038916470